MLKAYSLLELMISLAIIAMASIVMMNFLVISVQITIKSLARGFVSEEVSNDLLLMTRDIRNADSITSVNCPHSGSSICEVDFISNGVSYRWTSCTTSICKDVFNPVTKAYTNVSTGSKNVNIDYLDISYGYSQSNNVSEATILLTVSASHSNANLGISNIVRQASASTRNYEF